jgi:hypothetical protein
LWEVSRIEECAQMLLGSSMAKTPIYQQRIVTYFLRPDPSSPGKWRA